MIVQEDIPYTKEEIKAMVKTIHNLREKLSLLGWRPASELPELNEYRNSKLVYALYGTNNSRLLPVISCVIEGKWHDDNIKWWCYPPTNL